MKRELIYVNTLCCVVSIDIGMISYHKGYVNGYVKASMIGCIGDICKSSEGCRLPVDYALKSNCPYEGLCVDGRCHVACLMPYDTCEDSTADAIQCVADYECSCEFYLGAQMMGCRCVDEMCAVIVE